MEAFDFFQQRNENMVMDWSTSRSCSFNFFSGMFVVPLITFVVAAMYEGQLWKQILISFIYVGFIRSYSFSSLLHLVILGLFNYQLLATFIEFVYGCDITRTCIRWWSVWLWEIMSCEGASSIKLFLYDYITKSTTARSIPFLSSQYQKLVGCMWKCLSICVQTF